MHFLSSLEIVLFIASSRRTKESKRNECRSVEMKKKREREVIS